VPAGPNANGGGGDPWGQQQAVRIGDPVGLRARIDSPNTQLELYNVATDPHEDHNLAGQPQYASLLSRMKALLLTSHRPQPGNVRPYDTAPLPAVTAGVKTRGSGLQRRVFAGQWPWAPDVRYLTPINESHAASLDLAVPALAGKPGAIEFTGYLSVPKTGEYVLDLQGGQRAHLWLHDSHLLDSEADTTAPRRSDHVILQAGLHPIRILATIGAGKAQHPLRLTWTVPGGTPQPVPATAFLHP